MLEFFVACHVSIAVLGIIFLGLYRENKKRERLIRVAFRLLRSRTR